MKKEKTLNIVNWILGIVLTCFGVALSTKSNLGLSMIAAPPYIIHVWLRNYFSWYTQGMSEYVWQAILLILTCIIVRRFRPKYLLSFLTAVLSGFVLDGIFFLLGGNGAVEGLALRIPLFAAGMLVTSLGIAFVFRTTMPVQVYELIVMEIADRYHLNQDRVKQVNDIITLVVAVALAWILTRGWNGVGIGTVVITFLNATFIALFGKVIDRIEKRGK